MADRTRTRGDRRQALADIHDIARDAEGHTAHNNHHIPVMKAIGYIVDISSAALESTRSSDHAKALAAIHRSARRAEGHTSHNHTMPAMIAVRRIIEVTTDALRDPRQSPEASPT